MADLEKAIRLAVERHRGQKDKNGDPYILHPLRVMLRHQDEEARIAGVLHDVVEDTPTTLKELKKLGFSKRVLEAVDCLTKREGEEYEDYLKRVEKSPLACRVKLADLEDNMDVRRMPEPTKKDLKRLQKYRKAWAKFSKA